MKNFIFTLILFISLTFSVNAQTIIDQKVDNFGNTVLVKNNTEKTVFEILGQSTSLSYDGKGFVLFMPSENSLSGDYTDWNLRENILNIDSKNMTKIYESLNNCKDVKISGVKVYASNKFTPPYRVVLKINYYINASTKEVTTSIVQTSLYDQEPILDQHWVINQRDVINLKNVISKYIK